MPMCLMAEAARCLYVHHVELTFLFVAKNININNFLVRAFGAAKLCRELPEGNFAGDKKASELFTPEKLCAFRF